MRIGDLKKRIELQYATRTADGMGGWTNTYSTEAKVWGAIWPISASEIIQANTTTMVVTHRIRIRYHDTIKSTWRIKYGDKYYAIISILNPNMTNKFLDIMAKEVA
jgi:SPP1 family predicted phage head-tail adaptor